MLLLQICFCLFLVSFIRGFSKNSLFLSPSHSLSLCCNTPPPPCCLSLSGLRIKTELHSRTVLDSTGRDYPPWSFYRQEVVQCKTLPEGLATSVLTDCVLACIREEKENGFIPFDPPLDLRKRGIWGAHAVDVGPVTTLISTRCRWWVGGTRFCILPCQRLMAPVPTGTARCLPPPPNDKRKLKRLSSKSSPDLLALKIQYLQPVFSLLLYISMNKWILLKYRITELIVIEFT